MNYQNFYKDSSGFLNFTKGDISKIPNPAIKCSNFKKKEKIIHLPPYYFCSLCLKQFCYGCTTNHLIENKNDKNHNINNMLTQDLINNKKDKIINKTHNIQNNIKIQYKKQIDYIENEKILLSNLKNNVIDKINDLNNYFEKELNFLKNMNLKFEPKTHNTNNNKDKDNDNKDNDNDNDNDSDIYNNDYNENNNYDFIKSLDELDNLIKYKKSMKLIYNTTTNIYEQTNKNINKKKNKFINDIIFNLENYKNNNFPADVQKNNIIFEIKPEKEDNGSNKKYLNIKRKRYNNNNEKNAKELSYEESKETLNLLFPNTLDKKINENIYHNQDLNNNNITSNNLILPIFD